jgi:hypothetical protein
VKVKVIVVEKQSGGCDYTIGCGVRVTEREVEIGDVSPGFRAESAIRAVLREMREQCVKQEYDGDYTWESLLGSEELARESATIYVVEEEAAVPLRDWREELETGLWDEQERAERTELERLRKKYG